MSSPAAAIRVRSLCAQMCTESHWLPGKASAAPAGRHPQALQALPQRRDILSPAPSTDGSSSDRWLRITCVRVFSQTMKGFLFHRREIKKKTKKKL